MSLLAHQAAHSLQFLNKKHLKNVGPIRHREPPHAHSPGVASGTVARPAHRCPRQRQRQRVTEGTAVAPRNGPTNRLITAHYCCTSTMYSCPIERTQPVCLSFFSAGLCQLPAGEIIMCALPTWTWQEPALQVSTEAHTLIDLLRRTTAAPDGRRRSYSNSYRSAGIELN